jgi:hypothetical protein
MAPTIVPAEDPLALVAESVIPVTVPFVADDVEDSAAPAVALGPSVVVVPLALPLIWIRDGSGGRHKAERT